MNSVDNIIDLINKDGLTDEVRVELKNLGPPRPDLNLLQTERVRKTNKDVRRKFQRKTYSLAEWLCGCDVRNSFFCYVCLVMNSPKSDRSWISRGVTDLKHFKQKIIGHKGSSKHINNSIDYSKLGKAIMMCQLDSGQRLDIIKHNERVGRNRHVLNKLIECIKFCGTFELTLKSETTTNPNIFRGVVSLMSEIDNTLKEHVDSENNGVFMGLSKTIQNELLDAIYSVCLYLIHNEISEASYIAIEVDEMTDCARPTQMCLIVRYEMNGQIYERFMGFLALEDNTVEGITRSILSELEKIKIDKKPEKLIAQCYDGASVMGNVPAKIKSVYKQAHYIHCYAHDLHSLIERAASQDRQVRIFFCNLEGFSSFFAPSSKPLTLLDDVFKQRHWDVKWDFEGHCVTTVATHKSDIITCLDQIVDDGGSEQSAVRTALALRHTLTDYDFDFWLTFFNKVIPCCDSLSAQLQLSGTDVVQVRTYVSAFKSSIELIRNSIDFDNSIVKLEDDIVLEEPKRPRFDDGNGIAKEVCDIIVSTIDDRFAFNAHLSAALLFQPNLFSKYRSLFPESEFKMAVQTFHLESLAFRNELGVLHKHADFENAASALSILQFLCENNLVSSFVESVKLLRIVCTMPMTTAEDDRRFSTVKRIRTFTRNAPKEERLSALAMCSIEKRLLENTPNFNELVIEQFAKKRRVDFSYTPIN